LGNTTRDARYSESEAPGKLEAQKSDVLEVCWCCCNASMSGNDPRTRSLGFSRLLRLAECMWLTNFAYRAILFPISAERRIFYCLLRESDSQNLKLWKRAVKGSKLLEQRAEPHSILK
jgi:hypothetical protein